MKQYETVIQVMKEQGGFATLGQLNQLVDVKSWKTKTPFATIRRIVQDKRFFFKIKPGLWALKSYKDKISDLIPIDNSKSKEEIEIFDHSYYQGLVVEIGNFKGYHTFIPNQDKNKRFLNNTLGKCATLDVIHKFTYDEIIDKAKTIDVIWFDDRKFPQSFFEVEHSTDFQNSLLKMLELRSFYAKFNIIADDKRFKEYQRKISYSAFNELKGRVKFISYEKLSEYHSKSFEYFTLNNELQI